MCVLHICYRIKERKNKKYTYIYIWNINREQKENRINPSTVKSLFSKKQQQEYDVKDNWVKYNWIKIFILNLIMNNKIIKIY